KDSASRTILFSNKFEFLTVEFAKKELSNHKNEILGKVHIKESNLDALMSSLFKRIYVVDDVAIKESLDQAKLIMDKIDPDDTPFIALALAVENDGIWSDDKHFVMQRIIKVWKTSDMLRHLE
ncbi:Nucleotide-binding protein, PIN domain protein, partial [mine drainage metagenome]